MLHIASLLTGIFIGLSSGVGLFPIWIQPKNIRIQGILFLLGLPWIIIMAYEIFILHH